jgi:DNA-binding IclR family transcriptional regulator
MVTDDDDEKIHGSAGVQSVETGASLLLALAELGRSAPLKDIAAAAGMHPAKAHRYIASFIRSKLIARDIGGGYGFGSLAVRIGIAALTDVDIVRMAPPYIAALRTTIEETVALSVWGTYGPTFLYIEEAARTVLLSVKAGSVVPLLSSATGRVFAAFHAQHIVAQFIKRELLASTPALNASAVLSAQEADSVISEVRRVGSAAVSGQVFDAISAPIFNHQNKLVAAITAVGAPNAFPASIDHFVHNQVRATAAELSMMLGCRKAYPG